MAAKKQYWLLTYRVRQYGEPEADATYYMTAIDKPICAWVEEIKNDPERDYALINHVPITAAEFKRLEGEVL